MAANTLKLRAVARALMDAGVHRILITVTDDRRSRD
jgi:hypothetical protein